MIFWKLYYCLVGFYYFGTFYLAFCISPLHYIFCVLNFNNVLKRSQTFLFVVWILMFDFLVLASNFKRCYFFVDVSIIDSGVRCWCMMAYEIAESMYLHRYVNVASLLLEFKFDIWISSHRCLDELPLMCGCI